jgi:hypothetical protein
MSTPWSSFNYFSSSHISSNLNSVGVSLGSNLNKIIFSTNVLRHLEFDRIKVIPKISNVSEPLLLDEEEADTTIDG